MSIITKSLLLAFIFVSGVVVYNLQLWLLNPFTVGDYAARSLANMIGVSASVPSNPFNKLAKQLQEKEKALALREAGLEKDMTVIIDEPIKKQNIKINVLLGIGGVLFFMILINFYLDLQRRSKG